MIFLTVGTQLPFDRLVKTVDKAIETGLVVEEIYAQIGEGSYQPHNFRAAQSVERHLFDKYVRQASSIISHAGMGTIIMALENNKPLLIMPRRKKYGEVVNDHQVAIAKKFERSGHILVAYQQEDIPAKIKELKSFIPKPRTNQTEAFVEKIVCFLKTI